MDDYVDVQVAIRSLDQPDQLENALALAEQAVTSGRGFRPAVGLLSYLLAQKMLWSSQTEGDALGRRGLTLLEPVLNARKDNIVYLTYRVYI